MTGHGLRVIQPGFLTLIQDYGRTGFFRHGITVGGPADKLSFDWANRLVGNTHGACALEVTLGNLQLESQVETTLAVTGPDTPLFINNRAVEGWRAHAIQPGDTIKIGALRRAMRCYLSVKDGFQITPTLGSTATVVREKLGGLNGGPLNKGDFLPVSGRKAERLFALPTNRRPLSPIQLPLQVISFRGFSGVSRHTRRQFFQQAWEVSTQSNRMGTRLTGSPLNHSGHPLLSEGLVAGTIQLPPDGLPIVMLNDHQTIGGYPKIGAVIRADLGRLGQMLPGSSLRFSPVTPHKAAQLYGEMRRFYEASSPIVVG